MTFFGLFSRHPHRESARALYGIIVTQARHPDFYLRCGVPDTVDGRFDMISLHAFVVLRRLKEGGAAERDLAQEIFDTMFADMDHNLREMGTGDLGVGRKVKDLAEAFYGRIRAYDLGLAGGPDDLDSALRRNLFRKSEPSERQVGAMAAYLRRECQAVGAQFLDDLKAGKIAFGPAPIPGGDGGP